MSGKIPLNHRRGDDPEHAGRLQDALIERAETVANVPTASRALSRLRSKAVVTLALAGVIFAAGCGSGGASGNGDQNRMAVRDGQAVYDKIREVSKTVETAKDLLKQAVDASSGGPGKQGSLDFGSIEQLVALKRPFGPNEFHRRLYRVFGDNAVDELFDYYNNINILWDGFSALGAQTSGQARREALLRSATATERLPNTDYGLVSSKTANYRDGDYVLVTIPQQSSGKSTRVGVPSSQAGQGVERRPSTEESDVAESPEKSAVLVDKARSPVSPDERAKLFAKLRGDLLDLSVRMDKTLEVQARLLKDLASIAGMTP